MRKFHLLRHLMLLSVGLSFALSASGSETSWKLQLWDNDGTRLDIYELKYTPKVTFTETEVVVTTSVADVYFYSLPDMWKFTYESTTGIDEVAAADASMKFDGQSIVFHGLNAGSDIAVYAVNGVQVMSKTVNAAGDYSFSLSSLSQGVYVVNVNGKTFKIVKR